MTDRVFTVIRSRLTALRTQANIFEDPTNLCEGTWDDLSEDLG